MNPFSKRIHQIKNPDLDLPKGTRNPFLDLKSVFGFTERNTPSVSKSDCQSLTCEQHRVVQRSARYIFLAGGGGGKNL